MELPLVLLPGLNNTPAVFSGVIEAMRARIDARPMALPARETVEEIAAELLPSLPERFNLCGFSFGGYVALAMLDLAPERIAGLCLVGSLPGADSPETRTARLAAITAALDGNYESIAAAAGARAFLPENLDRQDLMDLRAAMVAEYGAKRFIAHSRAAMARPDRTELLTGYTGPLAMMAGEHDPIAPRQAMEALVGSRSAVIRGAAHLLPMEQPAAMAERLEAWLSGGHIQ